MKRKNRKYLWLLLLLLGVTIGYALVSTTLKITGSATVTKQTWDVYWGVPTVTAGSKSMTAPIRGADSGDPANTKLTWSVTLDLPGDFYEFTVDAVNAGSIDAMITGINPTVSPALPTNPDYIKYSVTYADGIDPAVNHLLPKADTSTTPSTPTTEKYKVRVYYDENAATAASINGMSGNTTYTFTLNITYGQATDDAIPKPVPVWTLPQGKTASTLSLGDELCASDQCFNFIRYDGNDVVLLAKYNLKVGDIYTRNQYGGPVTKTGEYTSSDPGYGLQSSDARGNISELTEVNGVLAFSKTNYWNGNVSSYPADIYDATYTGEPGTSTHSLAYYIEPYKSKLVSDYNATIKSARLITSTELADNIGCSGTSCPTTGAGAFITNTSFWAGTAIDTGAVLTQGTSGYGGVIYLTSAYFGVRPVIVVEKSNL